MSLYPSRPLPAMAATPAPEVAQLEHAPPPEHGYLDIDDVEGLEVLQLEPEPDNLNETEDCNQLPATFDLDTTEAVATAIPTSFSELKQDPSLKGIYVADVAIEELAQKPQPNPEIALMGTSSTDEVQNDMDPGDGDARTHVLLQSVDKPALWVDDVAVAPVCNRRRLMCLLCLLPLLLAAILIPIFLIGGGDGGGVIIPVPPPVVVAIPSTCQATCNINCTGKQLAADLCEDALNPNIKTVGSTCSFTPPTRLTLFVDHVLGSNPAW